MDEKGFGYDFTTNLKVTGKSQYMKDIADVQKAKKKWYSDESLRSATASQYASVKESRPMGGFRYIRHLADQTRIERAKSAREESAKTIKELALAEKRAKIEKHISERGFIQGTRAYRQANVFWNRSLGFHKREQDEIKKTHNHTSHWLRRVLEIGAAYLSIRAAHEQINKLIEVGGHKEQLLNNSRVFFGNDKNTEAMIEMVKSRINSGKIAGDINDIVEGMKTLQMNGVDAQKYMGMVADMAGRTGKSFGETSNAIQAAIGGSEEAFKEYGIQAIEFRRITQMYRANTPEMKNAVLGFLRQQKQFKGGAKDMADTLEGYKGRFKSWMYSFRELIIGSPKDTTSLMFAVKRTFAKISAFVQSHKKQIEAVAHRISEVLKWVWQKVSNVFDKIMKGIGDIDITKFQQKTMRLITWLEVAKNKVKEWGKVFLYIAGGVAAFKLLSFLDSVASKFGLINKRSLWIAGAMALLYAAEKYKDNREALIGGAKNTALNRTTKQKIIGSVWARPKNISGLDKYLYPDKESWLGAGKKRIGYDWKTNTAFEGMTNKPLSSLDIGEMAKSYQATYGNKMFQDPVTGSYENSRTMMEKAVNALTDPSVKQPITITNHGDIIVQFDKGAPLNMSPEEMAIKIRDAINEGFRKFSVTTGGK